MSDTPDPVPSNTARFQLRIGTRRVDCTVLDGALEAASGLAYPSTAQSRRQSFDRYRTLIHQAAQLKSSTLPTGFTGPIVLTADDLRRVPPLQGVPVFGSAARVAAPGAVAVPLPLSVQDKSGEATF